MSSLKVTYTFAEDKYTWSESHWFGYTGSNPNPNVAVSAAVALAGTRVPCLGNGCQLIRIRITQALANRQAVDLYPPFFVTTPQWPGDPTGLVYSSARAFAAVLGSIEAADGNERNYYVAGCPSSALHTAPGDRLGIQWASCPDFSPRMAALAQNLTNGQWGWMSRKFSSFQQVQGIVTNAAFPGTIGLVIANQLANNPQVGAQVLVKNFRRINIKLPHLGGVWAIAGILPPVAPATTWTYFLLNSGQVPTNNYKGMGLLAPLQYVYETYTQVYWVEATQRKRGGSLLAPRGRSRSRI